MTTATDTVAPLLMHQVAPYPHVLAELVRRLRYRQHMGWEVRLEDDLQRDKPGRHTGESRGMTLVITRCGPDTYHPDRIIAVNHYFAVPPATYNRQSWMWWLFERLGSVDTHERMEDFAIAVPSEPVSADEQEHGADDHIERPYAPCHGPGWDPYLITVERTETDRRTSFRGELNPL
jgi:hypothetical protein